MQKLFIFWGFFFRKKCDVGTSQYRSKLDADLLKELRSWYGLKKSMPELVISSSEAIFNFSVFEILV